MTADEKAKEENWNPDERAEYFQSLILRGMTLGTSSGKSENNTGVSSLTILKTASAVATAAQKVRALAPGSQEPTGPQIEALNELEPTSRQAVIKKIWGSPKESSPGVFSNAMTYDDPSGYPKLDIGKVGSSILDKMYEGTPASKWKK